jgi:hypothetical protein
MCLNGVFAVYTSSTQARKKMGRYESKSLKRGRRAYRKQFEHDGRSLLHFRFACLQEVHAFIAPGGPPLGTRALEGEIRG